MNIYTASFLSPIGLIEIQTTESAVRSVIFVEQTERTVRAQAGGSQPDIMAKCLQQLDEYFCGKREQFELPLMHEGTSFQQRVWEQVKAVPYGQTIGYRELAVRIGQDKAIRAVGTANGRNRLALLIPCHRVIGSDGQMRGYAWGLWRKEWLLQHEAFMLSNGAGI